MPPEIDTISFLSDYGLDDEFVGVVKAVIRGIAPHATVIDITHQVPPHDTRAGALALARSMQYLPHGVVLAIVDPGVGSARRALAVEVGGAGDDGNGLAAGEAPPPSTSVLLGPDNGLLASAVAMAGGARRAVSLTNPDYQLAAPGPTFAGRDVFAPAAAYLCNGVDIEALGEPVDPLSLVPGLLPLSRQDDDGVVGEVLWVDRFGNVQLNIDPDEVDGLGEQLVVRFGDQRRTASRVSAYSELKPGQLGVLVDSYGLLSIVLDRRSAAHELRLAAGDAVTVTKVTD